jgi:hypothetical protein
MSANVLRTSALGGRWTAAWLRAEERGLPRAPSCLGVATSEPSARGLRPGAPGRDTFAPKEHLVTAEMRGFAASISAVRAGQDSIGRSVV